jgi:hypothetical protein
MRDPNTGQILLDPDTGRPRMIGEDINHTVSKAPYEREFYKASGRWRSAPHQDGEIDDAPSPATPRTRWTRPSRRRATTRRTTPAKRSSTTSSTRGSRPPSPVIDDVCDTVTYKSNHWFDKADEAAAAGDLP